MAMQTGIAHTATVEPEPVRSKERVEVLDMLRGFALFGILMINITAFAFPGIPPTPQFAETALDRWSMQVILLLVESKFFTLFSFLFGLGFAIQLLRAQERGVRFVPRFTRRLFALLAFGVTHVVFFWEGDILVIYALVGFLLLLFRNHSPRTLLRWIMFLLLVPIVLLTIGLVTIEVLRFTAPYAAELQAAEAAFGAAFAQARTEALQLYTNGTYGDILVVRLADYATVFPLLVSRIPSILAMFLLGLYVGKRGIVQHVAEHLPLLRRVHWWGLSLGFLTSGLIVAAQTLLPPISAVVALLFNQALAGPILSMGYAATLALLACDPVWQRRFAPLAATGRMALTNYLLQSAICTTVFYGYGFGLAGRVSVATCVGIAVVIYAAQLVGSRWWLRRFQFGPLEWLWRSITYLRPQPLRRNTRQIA